MLTKLSVAELEEILKQPKAAEFKALVEQQASGQRVEWYKEALSADSRRGPTEVIHTIGKTRVLVFCFFITTIPEADRRSLRESRNPMFVLRRAVSPTTRAVKLNFTILNNQASFTPEMVDRCVNNMVHIPTGLFNDYLVLLQNGLLATLFQQQSEVILPKEVRLDLPFFEGVKRPHLQCLSHGKFKPHRPMPKELLNGAEWYDSNFIRL